MNRFHNILIFTLLFMLVSTAASAKGKVIDEVIWIIGDEAILKSEIETEILRYKYEKQDVNGDPYCVIPEQLALQKLFVAQAKIDSVAVSESTIEQNVEGRIKYFIQRIGSKEKAEEYFGKTIEKMREEMKRTVADQLLVQEMQQKITSSYSITPSDVERFYNELPKDSIPTIPEQVEVQIISYAPTPTATEVERVKSQLREFKEKVESGESQFSTLAILYSEDKGSAMQGGELGFMTKGKLVPEFANVAFSMYDTKKVSRIVESEFGFHIIQLIERKTDQVNCRHILMTPKIGWQQKQEAMVKLDSIANEIRAENITFGEAALKYSEDKESRENEGLMINQENTSNKFQIQQLPADIAKAVYSLQIGEISKPFIYTNEAGKEFVCIIRLKSRVKAHKATPKEDFNALKEIVTASKNKELIESWIAERQKEMYIHINPEYRNCKFQYPGWIKQ